MAVICGSGGPRKVTLTRDVEGYREYKATFRIEVNPLLEGPLSALYCPGLPLPGSFYTFLHEFDLFVWCRANAGVRVSSDIKEGHPAKFYDVDVTLANKPIDDKHQRCQDSQTGDPLMEPMKITGGNNKYTEEASYDRFGLPIVNSAWELIRGPQVEFDKSRPYVKIQQNYPLLQLDMCTSMLDTVNQFPLWGLDPRKIKLSAFEWERKFWGQCAIYYSRSFTFDIRFDTFDRTVLDEGSKALNGKWFPQGFRLLKINGKTPDYRNPAHFRRFKDRAGENSRVVLNGRGRPYDPDDTGTGSVNQAGNIFIAKYGESNFLALNIPTSF